MLHLYTACTGSTSLCVCQHIHVCTCINYDTWWYCCSRHVSSSALSMSSWKKRPCRTSSTTWWNHSNRPLNTPTSTRHSVLTISCGNVDCVLDQVVLCVCLYACHTNHARYFVTCSYGVTIILSRYFETLAWFMQAAHMQQLALWVEKQLSSTVEEWRS